MRAVRLSTRGWSAHGFRAVGFIDRLRGNLALPKGSVVILPTRSVHSLGQHVPLQLVGLDSSMRVVAIRRLAPQRVTLIRSARMIIEIPEGAALPPMGQSIEVTDV